MQYEFELEWFPWQHVLVWRHAHEAGMTLDILWVQDAQCFVSHSQRVDDGGGGHHILL